ncbi:MAG: ATP-binding protein [Acidobacteriota bacterium]
MPTTNPLPTGQLREQIPALSIDELRRLGTLLATQGQALELIARGADLNAILEALCLLIERESPDSICSILLMRDGCLRLGPGPNLPPEYAQGLDGLALGEAKGSCGTAAFRREPVIVTDIASSPLWVEFRDFALCHGIAACWSIPIFDRHDRVVGTFAISHQEPRKPTRYQLELLHTAGHLASIAIDRQHADDERQRLEHSLMHRQKLESLGLMAGGIAHDFNNLLTAIVGNLSLLENEPSLSRKGRRRVELAMTAATSATALTTQMLTYAGLASVEIGELDLAAEIRAAVDPLRATLRPGVTISLDLGTEIGLRGDVGQIRQLISNLVLNGVDALGDADGEIAVSVSTQELTASAPKVDHAGDPIPSGRYVVLDVRDPGHGIDPSQIHQIFDPFYSSKRSGRGLGLAMVLGGARAHDAPLCIASRLGAGTTISVFFPESRWVSRPTWTPGARRRRGCRRSRRTAPGCRSGVSRRSWCRSSSTGARCRRSPTSASRRRGRGRRRRRSRSDGP